MPRGIHMLGRKLSKEVKKKISLSCLGNKNCLGNKLSEEHKKKISLKLKGRLGISRPHTLETKQKIKLNNSRYWLGKKKGKMSLQTRKKISKANSGSNSRFWEGGITSKNAKLRNSLRTKICRDKCFKRDSYTCQDCKKIGGKLQIHHIKPFSLYPKHRFILSNLITLCIHCHKKTDTYLKGKIIL